MTSTRPKRRFLLEDADRVAADLVAQLAPSCARIAVAGSVRRRKPAVGDIELLAVPLIDRMADLFGQPTGQQYSHLDAKLEELRAGGTLALRLNIHGLRTYGPLNKLMLHVPSGIPVDLFAATPENWGMALLVRTGPAAFNVLVMTRLIKLGLRGHAYGGVTDVRGKREIACPTEQAVFVLLNWGYMEPWEREERAP